jgi:hypothetical protein
MRNSERFAVEKKRQGRAEVRSKVIYNTAFVQDKSGITYPFVPTLKQPVQIFIILTLFSCLLLRRLCSFPSSSIPKPNVFSGTLDDGQHPETKYS